MKQPQTKTRAPRKKITFSQDILDRLAAIPLPQAAVIRDGVEMNLIAIELTFEKSKRSRDLYAAMAACGIIPPFPDVSAATHDQWREAIDVLSNLIMDRDLIGLFGYEPEKYAQRGRKFDSSTRKLLVRHCSLVITALQAAPPKVRKRSKSPTKPVKRNRANTGTPLLNLARNEEY